jgi:Fe-S cluster assembly protein SufD
MSLARAIETGDVGELPSRRDEDWRWTDLRGLVRVLPAASPTVEKHVVVEAGETREINLRFSRPDATARVSRLKIEIGEDAQVLLHERYDGEGDYISEADIQISMGRGSRLDRIVTAADSGEAVSVSKAEIEMAPGACLAQTTLTTGARRQRLETRVSHPGAGASARLDGIYLLDAKRHADLTTVVTHLGVGGATDQLTKGVVRDQARGVFQGRIVVSPGADQTNARMGHHALVLSDRAEVDAKPELEIHADDVSCAHGNTVGALDEEALFYALQRGIPEAEAKAMLTEAFVGEVVERIENEGARDIARAWVAEHLRGSA